MSGLDASAKAVLAKEAETAAPPVESGTPEQARQDYLDSFALTQKPLEEVAESFETYAGRIRLKVWRGLSAPKTDAAALLYLHGGGWVVGAPETHEDICRALANRVGGVVISPDYRLAPEHPFPAALEDCEATLAHLHSNPAVFGIDTARVVLGGDSAGGNLAAVLALMARDGTVPQVLGQLLIYPVTDQSQTSDSYRRCAMGFGLTATAMAWFRGHYLPDRGDWSDWRASPLHANSLAGVAPAFVALAGQDVLFDEGAAYAARLAAEAQANLRIWPGQIHGFASMGGVIPETAEVLDAIAEAWRGFDPALGA